MNNVFSEEDRQGKPRIPLHDVTYDHETFGSVAGRATWLADQEHDDLESNIADDNQATQRFSALLTALDITLNVVYRSQNELERQQNALVRRRARLDIFHIRIPWVIQFLWLIGSFALGR